MNRNRIRNTLYSIPLIILIETTSSIAGIAYGTEITDTKTQPITFVSKASNDEIGIQNNKLLTSKSKDNIQDILSSQEKTLHEDKIEYEQKLKEEEEERQRIEEEKRLEEERQREEEERQRQEEELRKQEEQQAQQSSTTQQSSGTKMVISSYDEAKDTNILSRSNWTYDDFDKIVPSTMKPLINIALRMENEKGVNALYLMAVGANETGWGNKMSGNYNYFNWSRNGIKSLDFSSLENFSDYSTEHYDVFTTPSNYTKKLGYTPTKITPPIVNILYAVNLDGDGSSSTNTEWTTTVCKIMTELSNKRLSK